MYIEICYIFSVLHNSLPFLACLGFKTEWNPGLNLCDDAETNQELIMAQGGIGLLAQTADDAEDPQTLRMVAGAIANLCGNGTNN